ncbi:MAG: hypothetical protein AAF610_03725 [Pseudomonadota bacterium]
MLKQNKRPLTRDARPLSTFLVPVLLLLAPSVAADTLLVEFDTLESPADIRFPDDFSDYEQFFGKGSRNSEFSVRLVLPNFEAYQKGEHTIPLNLGNGLNWGPSADKEPKISTPGLSLTLESRAFGALEGERIMVRTKNAKGRTITGPIFLPDETQLGDEGELVVRDGKIVSFAYRWVKAGNPGLVSMNDYLVKRRRFPIKMDRLEVEASAFSEPFQVGDLILVKGLKPRIMLQMVSAKD